MMTKPDQREQTETPEDGPVAPPDAEVREQLDIILASDEFSSSRRASELLQHLVERALMGDTASLKERLLGIDIFHRRSDYNTSTDAIVRVTANDVRRRLAQFYSRHPVQPLRISLPLGSYIPDFIAATASAPHSTLAGSPATRLIPNFCPRPTSSIPRLRRLQLQHECALCQDCCMPWGWSWRYFLAGGSAPECTSGLGRPIAPTPFTTISLDQSG